MGIFLLFLYVTSAWADMTDTPLTEDQISDGALIPGHTGEDYSFMGNYLNGQVTITGPGKYHLTDNLTTISGDYAIRIESPDVTLDGYRMVLTGPGDSGEGVTITSDAPNAVVTNFSSVSGFFYGIISQGEHTAISDSVVHDNHATGISTSGNYSEVERNFVFNHSDIGIYSFGHYSIIADNYAAYNRNGILSQGNYPNVSGNAGNDNSNYGIYAGGMYTGPEPGTEGHGYYARLIDNVAILNSVGGIKSALPHAIIRENSVFQNADNGIAITWRSSNTTISDNYISDNPTGIIVSDQVVNVTVTGNLIRSGGNCGIYVESGNGKGNGAIYDNILSGQVYVNGTGKTSSFLWTNPAGPTPGSNIMDGPYIAGNYWTNAYQSGWSDQQPVNPKGYTITPYEVSDGVYDFAPLVKTTVKPTPTPTPVPLSANFSASPVTGVPPLSVQFTDLSPGLPATWRWNFGDGSFSALQNPLHIYGGIGRYTVTLEVGNHEGTAIVRKTEFVKTSRPKR